MSLSKLSTNSFNTTETSTLSPSSSPRFDPAHYHDTSSAYRRLNGHTNDIFIAWTLQPFNKTVIPSPHIILCRQRLKVGGKVFNKDMWGNGTIIEDTHFNGRYTHFIIEFNNFKGEDVSYQYVVVPSSMMDYNLKDHIRSFVSTIRQPFLLYEYIEWCTEYPNVESRSPLDITFFYASF